MGWKAHHGRLDTSMGTFPLLLNTIGTLAQVTLPTKEISSSMSL